MLGTEQEPWDRSWPPKPLLEIGAPGSCRGTLCSYLCTRPGALPLCTIPTGQVKSKHVPGRGSRTTSGMEEKRGAGYGGGILRSGSGFAFPVSPKGGRASSWEQSSGGIPAPTALIPREHPWLATGEGMHRGWGVLEMANSAARSRVLCGRQKDEEGK